MKNEKADIIIVGAGAAGLMAALTLSPRKVLVINEKPLNGDCSSIKAQAGIAAAVDAEDTPDLHAADTMKAAAGMADESVVRALTAASPDYIKVLEKYGVRFERDADGGFILSREACHARRRVLKARAGDGFGAELMRALTEAVRHTPSISYMEGLSAERLIVEKNSVRGLGVRRLADGTPALFTASAVLLATGGIGGLYAVTTNPLHAVGRGIALAARAGAVLADLEFVQFHPTALDIGEDPAPLATEALRGEGARLLNSRGERFMLRDHDMAELAPRDVVSRSIFAQMQKGQRVYLDCRMVDAAHFPTLVSACARAGIDPQHALVPVAPAVHYHMGGVATDLNGQTSVKGLWAAGEVAATGLHGANRLASNSLMEAVIMGARAAHDIKNIRAKDVAGPVTDCAYATNLSKTAQRDMPAAREMIRQIMNEHVGVIRDRAGLMCAIDSLADIERRADLCDRKTADMAFVARLIATAALARTESRGAHCRSDYPEAAEAWKRRSFITPIRPRMPQKEGERVA